MPPVKQFAGYVLVGAICSVFNIPAAHAATVNVVVNDERLVVQTPQLGAPLISGITYKVTDAPAGSLTVYTEGFLFCTNLGGEPSGVVTLLPMHESQDFAPAHAWTFPSVKVTPFAYAGGVLSINRARGGGLAEPYLACHGVGAEGEVPNGLAEWIFEDAFELPLSETEANYSHLVNWIPPASDSPAFDWTDSENWNRTSTNDPDKVPFDPCEPVYRDNANVNRAEESMACAAVTGVSPVAAGFNPLGETRRAPSMWTNISGANFMYLFRLDADFRGGGIGQFPLQVRDAFDSTLLSNGGYYCELTDPPEHLDGRACAGAPGGVGLPFTGSLKYELSIDSPTTKYIVVQRALVPAQPPKDSPIPLVGVSVFMDPAVAGDGGGDRFTGDDVVFGFMPHSTGFPWMAGQ